MNDGGNVGLYYYTNDSDALNPGVTVDGFANDGVNNTPIYATGGTAWPWAWSIIGSNHVLASSFRLLAFNTPVNSVTLYFRARRTGFVQTSSPSRYSFGASNGGGIFASSTLYANYTWTNHSFWVDSSWTPSYNSTGWNYNMLSSVGDGFGGYPDEIEVSWFMLEIQQ